ncbi:methyltransferase, TIGR04325 family [Plastoroseomonas hellenica]|uniref:methyltransferase, TIGR04325 family n=1 Tax=Plastoroseomonas hellenica TaxID=2687306 RepID=UPI001BA6556B|nr:methyltransferase, TIGR04325 family [Plastoroseomonas hellenica]MBR0646530.1 methyltransferase, TIGR04325 family [Plastoroseomonas hellenica]
MLGRLWSLPGLSRIRRSGRLNALLGRSHGSHWGRFPTREAAAAYMRPSAQLDYDDDRVVDMNVESFSRIHLFDWPVMFHLQRMIARGELRRVTDFGGHVGVKYLAYRDALGFPDDLVWQVVDVPAMCRAGRRRSADIPQLRFHEALEDTMPSDVLLCSGSLQYVDAPLDQILARLPAPPPVILLNKVSVTEAAGFFTLESFGLGRMPHHVVALRELDMLRQRCGYELEARWDIPDREFEVQAADGRQTVQMIGEVWRRAGGSAAPAS